MKLALNKPKSLLSVCILLAVAGCSTTTPYTVEKSKLTKQESNTADVKVKTSTQEQRTLLSSLDSMKGAGVTPPNVKEVEIPKFDNEKVTITANNLPLVDFINTVYGELLGLDFALHGSVKNNSKRASLNISKATSKSRMYKLASDVLAQNDVVFDVKNDVYFFLSQDPNSKRGFNLGVGRNASDVPDVGGQILHIAPLYYADWRSMSRISSSLTSAKLQYLKERNSVLITGSKTEILQMLKIVNAFDRPSSKGRHIGIVELVYITPEELKEQLEEIFAVEGIQMVNKGQPEGTVAITPMKRQRSALVHSASEDAYNRVLYWAEKLDVPSSSDGKRYFTYFPKNVSAVDMGQSLTKLFQLSERAAASAASKKDSKDRAGGAGDVVVKDLAMAVDEIQNALVFYATASKYHETLELVKQLDVMPGQVLIEAAVAEVTLEGNFSQGIDWTASSNAVRKETSRVLSLADGLSYVINGLDFNATLKFLESNSKVNIVSRPRLLVRDGRTAQMNVGTEVPVITQTVSEVESSDKVLQSVQYRTTGVSLQVQPTINAKGVISMSLNQQVSEAGENKSSTIDSPVILNRTFSTELLALDGKTVVLGGLISENNSGGSSGVPFLRDIPVLGNLFQSKNKRNNRVELIVMITPRIITKQQDIDDAIEVFSSEYENMLIPSELN